VTTAFLNGQLNKNVYKKPPKGLNLTDNENKVCKLKRAIYGLKQSSRAWNQRVDKRPQLEHCVYFKSNDRNLTVIAVYVCRRLLNFFK
jgi:hypothetical protein